MNKELEERLWENGKSASDYPKDYIVIPVLEVIEMLEASSK